MTLAENVRLRLAAERAAARASRRPGGGDQRAFPGRRAARRRAFDVEIVLEAKAAWERCYTGAPQTPAERAVTELATVLKR